MNFYFRHIQGKAHKTRLALQEQYNVMIRIPAEALQDPQISNFSFYICALYVFILILKIYLIH